VISRMFSLMANCFTWIKKRREPFKKVTLLMVGLDNAGKTTTIADLKGDTTDDITPTVGFQNSSFTLSRFNVTLFDLGGGAKIRDIWKNYYAEVYGIVFVVDASDINRLEESKEVLHRVKSHNQVSGKPLLILANKQDIDGALNEEDVANQLDLNSLVQKHKCECQVFTCTAVLGQGRKVDKKIKKGFQWLLGTVSDNFGALSERVTKDVAEQKEEWAKELAAKRERVRIAREERERAEQEAAERAKQKEEESDDDVVVGKDKSSAKSTTPKPSTPEKQLKKKKKKKKKKTKIERDEENEFPPSSKANSLAVQIQRDENSSDTVSPRESNVGSNLNIGSMEDRSKCSSQDLVNSQDTATNKTAPAPSDHEDEVFDKLPPLAWGGNPTTLNGFPGTSGLGLRRLEPLKPLGGELPSSSLARGDEAPAPLAPLRNTKSWTRSRPNSEDHDIMT